MAGLPKDITQILVCHCSDLRVVRIGIGQAQVQVPAIEIA